MKHWPVVAFAFLAVFLLASSGGYCAEYYVDIDSNGGQCSDAPSQPGTIDKPWCTAIKGFKSAQPGDTVYFREGVYRQNVTIGEWYFSKKATAENRITFSGYQNETAVITCLQLRDNQTYWTHETGEIYSTPLTVQHSESGAKLPERIPLVTQDGIPLKLMNNYPDFDEAGYIKANGNVNDLVGEGQWTRDVNNWKLYVWARGDGNPGRYTTEFCEFPEGGTDTLQISANRGLRKDNYEPDNDEADYLTFQNLVFEGGYEVFSVTTDYVWLLNSTIRNSYAVGVKAGGAVPYDYSNPDDPNQKCYYTPVDPNQKCYYNSEHVRVENNDIYNWGGDGLDITGGDYWIIRNNRIHDSVFVRKNLPTTGILFKNNNVGSIAEKNIIYNINSYSGAITFGGWSWNGIKDEGKNLIARNNIIYNITAPAAVFFDACNNCGFYNNLIYNSNLSDSIIKIQTVTNSGINKSFYSNDSKIKNNIFYGNTVGLNLNYSVATGNSTGLEISYNLIDKTGSSSFGDPGSYETNSQTGTPSFKDAVTKDFHLVSGSPGINQGICLLGPDVNDDFDGKPRPQGSGCDIGPYEFEDYYCGDGTCDSDKGETNATCPTDCKCGNAICDADETVSCPQDCPPECVDTPTLMTQYIPQWKSGAITMLTLMQKMKLWDKAGCPPA